MASLTHPALEKNIHFAPQTTSIRCWCHQPRRGNSFFIVATLGPCLNNGLQQCDVFRNDGLSNDILDTLVVRPRPRAIPHRTRVATHCCPYSPQPRPQKMEGKNPPQLLHSPAHWSVVLVCQTWCCFLTAKIRWKRRVASLLEWLASCKVQRPSTM